MDGIVFSHTNTNQNHPAQASQPGQEGWPASYKKALICVKSIVRFLIKDECIINIFFMNYLNIQRYIFQSQAHETLRNFEAIRVKI